MVGTVGMDKVKKFNDLDHGHKVKVKVRFYYQAFI